MAEIDALSLCYKVKCKELFCCSYGYARGMHLESKANEEVLMMKGTLEARLYRRSGGMTSQKNI